MTTACENQGVWKVSLGLTTEIVLDSESIKSGGYNT